MVDRTLSAWAPLPLRLILGLGFMYHGFPKLFRVADHENFVSMLEGIGMPAPELMAWVAGGIEFFGGIALIIGLLTPMVGALGLLEMAVAAVTVHLPHGFNFMNITGMTETGPVFGMPGYEVNLLYIAGFLSLMLAGAGAWSVDAMHSRRVVRVREAVPEPEREIPVSAWTGPRQR